MMASLRARWTQWRRQRRQHRVGLDDAAWQRLLALPLLAGLSRDEQGRLRDLTEAFLDRKRFSGGGGLEIELAMCHQVAVQAALPILNLGLDWYDGWSEVILYAGEFVPEHEYVDEDGVVHIERDVRSGESWEHGPVILSWADVAAGAHACDGYNVVIHELAHKLDMCDGEPNGFPPLHPGMSTSQWSADFSAAYADHGQRVEADQPLIDPYAAEAPGEFFAVCSEYFFERPDLLQAGYPQVYRHLADFYRQTPLERLGYRGRHG